MTPVQMESGAPVIGPRACVECKGEGGYERSGCPRDCYASRTPEGCTHDVSEWVVCSRCEGAKVELCGMCGEPSTIRYAGEDYCDFCRPGEEREFDACSLCYRPLDMRERALPLCDYCQSVCEAHADLERARKDAEREERETGRRIA